MSKLGLSFVFLIFCGKTLAGTAEIHGITIEEKVNGTLIRIDKRGVIDPSQIAAWTSETGWFYVTVTDAAIDTTREWAFVPTGIVSEFESYQLTQVVQLGFKLTRQIGTFEIDTATSENEVVITLRLPVGNTASLINKVGSLEGEEVTVRDPNARISMVRLKDRLPYALMLAGAGFVAGGLVQSSGVEFILGGTMLLGGYLMARTNVSESSREM